MDNSIPVKAQGRNSSSLATVQNETYEVIKAVTKEARQKEKEVFVYQSRDVNGRNVVTVLFRQIRN